MKTLNRDIDVFNSFESAERAFIKSKVSCDFLYSSPYKAWYIDRSKTALKTWPKLYELVTAK